jgi:hypothetical protein
MAMQAQDTFVAELKTGPLFVAKGQVFADGHEVVKLDAGRGLLFKRLDLGDEDEPAGKAAAKRPAGKAS